MEAVYFLAPPLPTPFEGPLFQVRILILRIDSLSVLRRITYFRVLLHFQLIFSKHFRF